MANPLCNIPLLTPLLGNIFLESHRLKTFLLIILIQSHGSINRGIVMDTKLRKESDIESQTAYVSFGTLVLSLNINGISQTFKSEE